MKRTIFAAVAAMILIASVAGCAAKPVGDEVENTTSSTTTTTTTTTEATVSTTSTASTTTTVKPTTTSTTVSTTKAPTKVTQKTASQKEQNDAIAIGEANMTDEMKESIQAAKTCRHCGRQKGRENGHYRFTRDTNCPVCGELVKALDCHFHDCP